MLKNKFGMSRDYISSYITVKVSHLIATNDVPKFFRVI